MPEHVPYTNAEWVAVMEEINAIKHHLDRLDLERVIEHCDFLDEQPVHPLVGLVGQALGITPRGATKVIGAVAASLIHARNTFASTGELLRGDQT